MMAAVLAGDLKYETRGLAKGRGSSDWLKAVVKTKQKPEKSNDRFSDGMAKRMTAINAKRRLPWRIRKTNFETILLPFLNEFYNSQNNIYLLVGIFYEVLYRFKTMFIVYHEIESSY